MTIMISFKPGDAGSERKGDLPKVTQLVRGRARI